MSKAAKALILTWIMIGLLIAGGAGFYAGRLTAPKTQNQYPLGIQPQGGMIQPGAQQQIPGQMGGQKPTGSQQQLQNVSQQQPQQGFNQGNQGPIPSGVRKIDSVQ